MFTVTDHDQLNAELRLLDGLLSEAEEHATTLRSRFTGDVDSLLKQLQECGQDIRTHWNVVRRLADKAGDSQPYYTGKQVLEQRVKKALSAIEREAEAVLSRCER